MKKIISFLLAFTLMLGLCACGGNSDNNSGKGENTLAEGLNVGFGRESIMPETEVPLGGYGSADSRISQSMTDYLYTTCIAITEGEETVLLFTYDMVRSLAAWTDAVRQQITNKLGIPGDRIMLCATHTHSGPENTSKDSRIQEYKDLFVNAMVAAAETALNDRSAATLYGTKTQVENMTFVRHYLLSDNSYAGSNFGNFSAGSIVDHTTDADEEMILVKFDRADDKQDILLMNWQTHPDHSKSLGFNMLSSDFIGPLRTKLEKESGMQVAYFTGDAGNLNPFSKILSENHGLDWKGYGEKMAEHALNALDSMTAIEGEGIKATQVQFEYAYNHANEDKQAEAKEVIALGNTDAGNALAQKYGLGTYIEAANIPSRVNRPATGTMELNAFYVAGMAFITAPYEMFSDNGMFIKEKSPFEITLLCTNANDWNSYCATEAAYDYVSYESSAGHFARGCAEAAADKFVEMLNTLK